MHLRLIKRYVQGKGLVILKVHDREKDRESCYIDERRIRKLAVKNILLTDIQRELKKCKPLAKISIKTNHIKSCKAHEYTKKTQNDPYQTFQRKEEVIANIAYHHKDSSLRSILPLADKCSQLHIS